jgi:hypothetical protein
MIAGEGKKDFSLQARVYSILARASKSVSMPQQGTELLMLFRCFHALIALCILSQPVSVYLLRNNLCYPPIPSDSSSLGSTGRQQLEAYRKTIELLTGDKYRDKDLMRVDYILEAVQWMSSYGTYSTNGEKNRAQPLSLFLALYLSWEIISSIHSS